MPEIHTDMLTDPLVSFCLHLADSSLIMGHRLSEWTGHGPMLEQDIAISNIALDLIGQSRNFYQYAAHLINSSKGATNGHRVDEVTEDTLAYLRDAPDFRNLLITEIPNGDWAQTIMKLFLFSTYQFYFYRNLIGSSDKQLAAIAEKSLKEVTYHIRWSSEWVIRLGDGTVESNRRIKRALEEVWPYTAEIFEAAEYEDDVVEKRITVPVSDIKNGWHQKVKEVFDEATLFYPEYQANHLPAGGKNGVHSENLRVILADMQYLQRTYPGCEW